MRRRQALALMLGIVISIGAATIGYAASRATLSGTWIVTVETPQGAMENTWTLEQSDDGSLSGMTSSDMIGDTPFDGGWVDGDAFGFDLYIDFQGQGVDISYEGTFEENEMSGVLNAGGGQFTADFIGVRVEGAER